MGFRGCTWNLKWILGFFGIGELEAEFVITVFGECMKGLIRSIGVCTG